MERPYTVKEIDELRRVCNTRWMFGSTNMNFWQLGKAYTDIEKDKGVEELIRTYMLAGIVAQDILKEDGVL